MRCSRVRKSLIEYEEGSLPDARAREVEAHLGGCPDCSGLAAKLKLSRNALSSAEPVMIPEEASKQILVSLRTATPRHRPWTRLLRSPRAIGFGAAVAAVLVAVVVMVGLRTGGGPQTNRTVTKNATSKDSGFNKPSQEGEKLEESAVLPAAGAPMPLVKFTANDYTPDSLRLALDNLQVKKEFANVYTMSDSINLAEGFTRKVAEDFANLGGDAALLESMFSYITAGEPILLPCYVERARFQGRDCWIILLAGPPRSGGSVKLTRSEAWVMDPVKFAQNPDSGVVFFLEQK